jgi:4,5-dihydroxyphthalate decarboxylase
MTLSLTLGCGWYDRTEPLARGWVRPHGIDLQVETIDEPRELFDRLVARGDLDVAEFSFSEYVAMVSKGRSTFVALPIFISRSFRHSFICINTNKGIASPRDLEGRRIGVPLFTMSAAIWCRGVLREEYGVDLSEITWVEGAMEKPGSHGAPKVHDLTRPTRIERNASGKSLGDLLEAGEIDATLGARMPERFGKSAALARLFPDVRKTEIDSYRRTGAHPIMHLIVMRRELHEREPRAAKAIARAFIEAKGMALKRLYHTGAPRSMLPLLHAEVEETRAIFGDDPWPDGIARNKPTIDAMMNHMMADGIIARKPGYDELFIDVGLE